MSRDVSCFLIYLNAHLLAGSLQRFARSVELVESDEGRGVTLWSSVAVTQTLLYLVVSGSCVLMNTAVFLLF